MSWAGRRRLFILMILGAFGAALIAVTAIATFSKAPSCMDRKQNQGEVGVDCGGPCGYLCSNQTTPLSVRFTKAIPNGSGRTDVLAYVENTNANAAAKNAPFHVTLYGADQTLVAEGDGKIDIPPRTVVPIYLPGFFSGNAQVRDTFLTFDDAEIRWFVPSALPEALIPGTAVVAGTPSAPRITATLSNPSVSPRNNVKVVVAVSDSAGNVIAASQTIVPSIPGQGSATATFTWTAPFSASPAKIEVVPLVSLP